MRVVDERDKAVGALVGLAVGESLGLGVKGMPRSQILGRQNSGINEYRTVLDGNCVVAAVGLSQILMDNQDGLGAEKTLFPELILIKFSELLEQGKINYKEFSNSRRVLEHYIKNKCPHMAAKASVHEGSGCLVRLAPAVIVSKSRVEATSTAVLQTSATHSAVRCKISTNILANIVWAHTKGSQTSVGIELAKKHVHGDLTKFWSLGDYKDVKANPKNKVKSTAWCVDTLNAALWSFRTTKSFEEAVVKSASLGGDSDTIGAVTGQIAGSYYGLSGIPKLWMRSMEGVDSLVDLGNDLFDRQLRR